MPFMRPYRAQMALAGQTPVKSGEGWSDDQLYELIPSWVELASEGRRQ